MERGDLSRLFYGRFKTATAGVFAATPIFYD